MLIRIVVSISNFVTFLCQCVTLPIFQIECSNGQIGFGRKRRTIDVSNTDNNKLFEVTMSALIKVDFEEDAVVDKGNKNISLMNFYSSMLL